MQIFYEQNLMNVLKKGPLGLFIKYVLKTYTEDNENLERLSWTAQIK